MVKPTDARQRDDLPHLRSLRFSARRRILLEREMGSLICARGASETCDRRTSDFVGREARLCS